MGLIRAGFAGLAGGLASFGHPAAAAAHHPGGGGGGEYGWLVLLVFALAFGVIWAGSALVEKWKARRRAREAGPRSPSP